MTQTEFEIELEDLNQLFYNYQKEKRTMEQLGSIQQINDAAAKSLNDINALINAYNDKSAKILMREKTDEFKNFTPEYVQELVKDETANHLKTFLPKAEVLLKDVLTWLNIALNKKTKIRFPYRTSTGDIPRAQLGEMKFQRATAFFYSTKETVLIRSEVLSAYRSNEDDYFNSLVDLILMKDPIDDLAKNDLLQSNPDLSKLIQDVKTLYKDFAEKYGLDLLNIAIQTLLIVSTEVNQFVNALKGNNLYYFPKRMAEKMTPQQVALNIEGVNMSSPLWETQLDSLKFVHQIV